MPDDDVAALKQMGVSEILGQDTPPEYVAQCVSQAGSRAGGAPVMEHWTWPPQYDATYARPPTRSTGSRSGRPWIPNCATRRSWPRIRQVMAYACAHAPFYRRNGRPVGLAPGDFESWKTSSMYLWLRRRNSGEHRPTTPRSGDYLCVPDSEIHRVHGTSGTTGRPTAFAIGRADWARIGESHARVMWGMGIRPGDMVFVGAVFSLYMGSWATLLGS